VRRFLAHKGVGFETSAGRVPLVPSAILFDLGFAKPGVHPSREVGEAAAAAATDKAVVEGSVGAGTGATVGKIFGMKQAMKSGVGSFTVPLEGPMSSVNVSALVVVNAAGDVRDPATRKIIAGARKSPSSMEFADSAKAMKSREQSGFRRENTTLAVVATNAKLTKAEATKVAQLASLGMARAIDPVNTMSDGDLVIALSTGDAKASVDALGVAAAEAVAESILRAVRAAATLGGVPGLKK
jgi:L-aminopeptidase/D-esterase-like protein